MTMRIDGRALTLVLGLLASCAISSTDIPSDLHTVHGQITQIDAQGRVLVEGETARAWANGPIAESCPAQTSAGVILLYQP
jgi:hypothetical protein